FSNQFLLVFRLDTVLLYNLRMLLGVPRRYKNLSSLNSCLLSDARRMELRNVMSPSILSADSPHGGLSILICCLLNVATCRLRSPQYPYLSHGLGTIRCPSSIPLVHQR